MSIVLLIIIELKHAILKLMDSINRSKIYRNVTCLAGGKKLLKCLVHFAGRGIERENDHNSNKNEYTKMQHNTNYE